MFCIFHISYRSDSKHHIIEIARKDKDNIQGIQSFSQVIGQNQDILYSSHAIAKLALI